MPTRRLSRTPLVARALFLAACTLALACPSDPETTTTGTTGTTTAGGTDSQSTGSMQPTTATSTTDAPTTSSTDATDTSSNTWSTDGPTSTGMDTTTGELSPCEGLGEASCTPEAAGDIEFECRWLRTTIVERIDTRCEVVAKPARCVKIRPFNLGPGCYGYFRVTDAGTEVWKPIDCEEPIDAGLELCFPESDELADPACTCISGDYCLFQSDEATCTAASNALQTCVWGGDQCFPG